jgi:prolyl 4-hydroxylase
LDSTLASTHGKPLDAEWTRWLHHNMSRGCAIDELRGILGTNGFDAKSVEAAIAAFRGGPPVVPMPVVRTEIPRANLRIPSAVAHGGGKAEFFIADDFLPAAECDEIVALILAQLRPSTISTPPGGEYDTGFRTSRTCDLSDQIPAVARLDTRIAEAIGLERSLAEPTQGQHYEVGQVFKTHTDFFKPYELEQYSMGELGQRTWTFMIYLNDVEGGGETEFPDLGMKVSPRKGRAVIWNNLLSSGEGNNATRHQSLPVTAGTKTIITKWFRMKRGKPMAFASNRVGWKQPY